MKILITGSNGQLGKTLIEDFKNINKKTQIYIYTPSRKDFNLCSKSNEIISFIDKLNPDWVINCGAYTSVDKAEFESEKAYKINSYGPYFLAKILQKTGGKLIHISTDFVFDGKSNIAYNVEDKINPINTYRKTKALGENLLKIYLLSDQVGLLIVMEKIFF